MAAALEAPVWGMCVRIRGAGAIHVNQLTYDLLMGIVQHTLLGDSRRQRMQMYRIHSWVDWVSQSQGLKKKVFVSN